jgi:hypothetical protein
MKKKGLLLLLALFTTVVLAGCSVEDLVEHIDLDKIADFVLEASKTDLEDVKTAEQIKAELPQELAVVTVDDTVLESQVTHLAIRNRKTDNTRQTDWVECEVVVEGDGIYARYICELNYTYTRNGGWGLVEWKLNTDNMNLQVTEGTLTQQFADASMLTLSEEFGSDGVTFLDSQWDENGLRCTEQFAINSLDGVLLTQGQVEMTASLTLDTNKGLYYTWKEHRDDSGLVRGADISGTTWAVSGTADTTEASLAFRVESFSMTDQTLVVSACSAVTAQGEDTVVREISSKTVNWINGSNGVVTFSVRVGEDTWDCCFDAGSCWARINGSYLDTLVQCSGGEDLRTLAQEGADSGLSALDYQSTTTGNSWAASDGTAVYQIQVEYPTFSGSQADAVNQLVRQLVDDALNSPSVDTTQAGLDQLQADGAEKFLTLPFYDKLNISVQYNRNGYLSLLLTYTQRVGSNQVTYRYDALNYDLNRSRTLSQEDVLSASRSELGAMITSYASGSQIFTETTAASYVQAWVFSRTGVTLYLTQNETTGACSKVTIPYTEPSCVLDPES